MKKITRFALVLLVAFLAACGGGSESVTVIGSNDGGGVPPPPASDADFCILEVKQTAAYGYFGDYEITLNFASVPAGEKFYKGSILPNREWDYSPVDNAGKVLIQGWPNGERNEFSYGTTSPDGVAHWVDPSTSEFAFPVGSKDQHLAIVLGKKEICPTSNTGDNVITAVENLGGDLRRIYFDPARFSNLAVMKNYQKLSLIGQKAPNDAWIDHAVTDAYPCFYADINFPGGETMEFSLYVVKEDGTQEWMDPALSKFQCADHLCIKF